MIHDPLKRSITQTIGNAIDEIRLNDDGNSFVEMDQQVIYVYSDKYKCEKYFRVELIETTEDEYFKSIHHE